MPTLDLSGAYMIDDLMDEYLANADVTASIDYADMESVDRSNAAVDRMREIVVEVAAKGHDAILRFASLLEREPASLWIAHHLVELADLDPTLLAKCFARVEREKKEAEATGKGATAMGEGWWLREWRAKRS